MIEQLCIITAVIMVMSGPVFYNVCYSLEKQEATWYEEETLHNRQRRQPLEI